MMKLSEIKEILNAELILGEDRLNGTIFAGGAADMLEDILAAVAKGGLLLTGLTTEQLIRTARIADVGVIIFVRGKHPDKEALALAKSFGIPLLRTEYSMFVASGRLYMNGLRGLDGSW